MKTEKNGEGSELGDDSSRLLINPGNADVVETIGELGLDIVAGERSPADLTGKGPSETPDISEATHLITVRILSSLVVGNAPRHISLRSTAAS